MVKSKTLTVATVCLGIFSAVLPIASAGGQDSGAPGGGCLREALRLLPR